MSPKRPLLLAACLLAACVSTNAAVLDPTVKYQKICPDAFRPASVHRAAAPRIVSWWRLRSGWACSRTARASAITQSSCTPLGPLYWTPARS
jgi:hypothetical protein